MRVRASGKIHSVKDRFFGVSELELMSELLSTLKRAINNSTYLQLTNYKKDEIISTEVILTFSSSVNIEEGVEIYYRQGSKDSEYMANSVSTSMSKTNMWGSVVTIADCNINCDTKNVIEISVGFIDHSADFEKIRYNPIAISKSIVKGLENFAKNSGY